MVPTPTPAPPMPMQAMPAPIIFAAVGSMRNSCLVLEGWAVSMARVNCIVEIDAGENGAHRGRQERDQELERGQRHGHAERQDRARPAEVAKAAEHHDEAAEYLERNMARQHVGEQSHAVRDWAGQERQHLDEGYQ